MARKKRRAVKNAPIAKKFAKRKQKSKKETQLQQAVISFLTKQKQPASLSDILAALHLSRKEKSNIIKLLEELISDRKVLKRSKRYSIPNNKEHLVATIVINRKGFGFATEDGQPEHEKDIFIPARDLNGASHGDTIQVSVVGKSRGRREGLVIKVLKRAVKSLYGIFTDNGRGGHVTPDNERIPYVITISKQNTAGAIDGTIVKTDIIDYGSEHKEPTGK
ncbi:MAG: hypothetical protein GY702_00225, partial [Desulfobulbaceae bacterium]|nr:hypothetical protein [Desulfobulbaceae bacterium]